METIEMTDDNRELMNALIMLAAGIRNDDAIDKLVEAIQELVEARKRIKELESEVALLEALRAARS